MILVVEDDAHLLAAIKSKLATEQIDAVYARSFDEAVALMKNEPKIAAVWLDHYLIGKKDGIDFLTSIRKAKDATKDIPVIVVSNSIGQEKINIYKAIGIHKYFVKADTTLKEIITAIQSLTKS